MKWQTQLEWLLMMAWSGWQLSAVIDTFRTILQASAIHKSIRIGFDLILAMLAGIYLFRQIVILNGGEIRVVFLVAAGVGGWLYWRLFRGYVHWMTETIVRIIRLVIQYCKRLLVFMVFRPLFRLVRLIWSRLISQIIGYIFSPLNSSLTRARKRIKIFVRRLTKFD